LTLFTDWPDNKGGAPGGLTHEQFAASFFLFYLIGFYGLWRIPAGYKFINIKESSTLDRKQEILKEALESFNLKEYQFQGDMIHFNVKGFLWEHFKVTILLDDKHFYINTLNDTFDPDGGFIDLGSSFRLTKRIVRKIKKCL
jgi:hypothetical protein